MAGTSAEHFGIGRDAVEMGGHPRVLALVILARRAEAKRIAPLASPAGSAQGDANRLRRTLIARFAAALPTVVAALERGETIVRIPDV